MTFMRGLGTGAFTPTQTIPVGPNLAEIDAGDFDGDGILDVVLPLTGSAQVGVFLGLGNGNFQPLVPFPAPNSAIAVAVSDFDRDGRDDFVSTIWGSDQIALYTNDYGMTCPNPSFRNLGIFLDVGVLPTAIVTGDLDRDGRVDIVTVDEGANTFTVRLVLPLGFGPPFPYPTGTTPVSIALADFTSDGILDVVTANQGSNDLTVAVGDGAGGFFGPTSFFLGATPNEVVAADVSNDGKVDLIATLSTGFAAVALGDGTGAFGGFTNTVVGATADAVTVGDFDNDGLPDLAVTSPSANQIVTLQNVGGAFTPGIATPVGGTPTSVRAASFNGDANLDVVVSLGSGPGGSVRTMFGNGALGFTGGPVTLVGGGPASPAGLLVDDFNADGDKDVAVANQPLFGVDVLIGDGAGNFPTSDRVSSGEVPGGVATGDVDRDGFPDLVTTVPSRDEFSLMANDTAGFFGPSFFPSAPSDGRGVATGDFDHDGVLDLVMANASTDSIAYFDGLGGGNFAAATSFTLAPSLRPVWVTAGDFNDDGNLDVVTSNEGFADVSFLAGNGAGGFGVAASSVLVSGVPGISRAADLDFDGDLDLAVIAGNVVEIMTNNGTGLFTPVTSVALGGTGVGLFLSDFDFDGDIDIAATEITTDTLSVYWQTGPLTWALGPQVTLPAGPAGFDVADFNVDGTLDFVVPSMSADIVSVVLSTGPGAWALGPIYATPQQPVTARALDFNLDGNADVIVAARSGHTVSKFIGDGTGLLTWWTDSNVDVRRPAWMTIGDFNMDARPDFAVVGDTQAAGSPPPGVAVVLNTNCLPTRLFLQTEVSTCDPAATPFAVQPEVVVGDDGVNPIQCEANSILATIVPGSGTGGAVLSGTTAVVPTNSVASFTDLEIDLPGGGYQLEYRRPLTPRPLRSRTFSLDLEAMIFGPPAVCQGDTALYDAGAGFEMYDWHLDSAPVSMAQTVDLTSSLTPGLRMIDVDVFQDTCTDHESMLVDVTDNLSLVMISPPGPESVCDICTATPMSSLVTGGGFLLYQWGYRTSPVGGITDISGETGADYLLDGADFPGPGTYWLVLTVTPECGVPMVSSNVQVIVSAATLPNPLKAITTLATDTQNRLEWALPEAGACTSVRVIRRDTGSFPTDPTDTTTPNVLVGDFPCSGKKGFTDDTGLANGTTYHYAGWVWDGSNYSTLSRETMGRPFDNTVGPVRWAYATSAAAPATPGLRILSGTGTVYIVSNDNLVHAVDGVTGHWPTNWAPFAMLAPAQSRPPATNFPVGTGLFEATNGAVFVGSQDGDVYAIDGDEGDGIWQRNVGGIVQAAPAGIFTDFGGAQDLILVGSRDGGVPNVFRAFDVDDGSPIWAYDNGVGQGGDSTDIGIISGGAALDYTNQRVFFASHEVGSWSVYSVEFDTGSPLLEWAVGIGDVETSPVYLRDGTPRIVVADVSGDVHLLEADNGGAPLWPGPYNAGDGRVRGFVFPQFGTPNYIFSTDTKVTSIRDDGPALGANLNWEIPFTNPSTPLHFPNSQVVLLGDAGGRLYQIDNIDSAPIVSAPVVLGDGTAIVGAPSINGATSILYVGTTQGVIYAVDVPLP